jgi:hypothetical protein
MIEHPLRMTFVQQGLRATTSHGRAHHVGSSPHLVLHTLHRNLCSHKPLARARSWPRVESGGSRNFRPAVAERGRRGGSVPPATVRGKRSVQPDMRNPAVVPANRIQRSRPSARTRTNSRRQPRRQRGVGRHLPRVRRDARDRRT